MRAFFILVLALAALAETAGCRPSSQPTAQETTGAPAAQPAPTPSPELQAIVDAYRKIIVLLEDESRLEPDVRRQVDVVSRILFHENEQRLTELTNRLTAEISSGAPTPDRAVEGFLDYLESSPELHDADKLAFRDVVAELLAVVAESGSPARPELGTRLHADEEALAEIQALYEKELESIFGRFETRGMTVRREAWESYVAFLKSRIRFQDVLKDYQDHLRAILESGGTRGSGESSLETYGRALPLKNVVLTFDDGPHPRHTDRILEILQKFKVKAVFFEVGQNLGSAKPAGTVAPTKAAAASQHVLQEGYPLANHSFTHAFLPKLSDREIAAEIDQANRMLKDVSRATTTLFRSPYGARNDRVLTALSARGMKSIMWNIDSRDWADPIPTSIANRAIQTVEGEKRGIILFHDIHARTVEALPLVLETLQSRGYRFLTWNGKEFADETPQPMTPTATAAADVRADRPALYRESWAVIIGVDQYRSWPKLSYAANDARGVRDVLERRYSFKPENIVTLLNEEATREKILSALGDKLGDSNRVSKDDRVFMFFAGHGVTRKLPSGRSLGYLIPFDAEPGNYQGQAVSMTNFQDISDAIPAKHVFFVTDACYSGLALTRSGGAAGGHAYLQEVTRRTARQVLTAGGADEEVADNGPEGHSIFTWTLLQGLEGKADLNGDGFITASELAAYVGPVVSSLSRQTPAFGSLTGSAGGEFVFELEHQEEFLSGLSSQLDAEAIRLNAEVDRIRQAVAEKRARNEKLQKEVEAARAELAGETTGPSTPASHNDRGMAFFREKRYEEALAQFEAAVRLDPSSALAANNVGFTHYRMGRMKEAVTWFDKTIALDPRRAIAHANLGDAYLALGRKPEARTAFEKFLELQPGARYAPEVRKKLEELKRD